MQISPNDYPALKAFFVWITEYVLPVSPDLPPEHHPVAVLEHYEAQSMAIARKGLGLALGDIIEDLSELDPARVRAVDAALQSASIITLSEVRARFWTRIRRILERGVIRSENDYYALRNAVETLPDAEQAFIAANDDRGLFESFLIHLPARWVNGWRAYQLHQTKPVALAMVAEDLGEEAAKRAAQQLVVYHRRPGGQSQFSALLEMDRSAGRFSPLLTWARERLHERLTVERLADRVAMSPRHFARAFTAEIGMTPAKAVELLRIEAARARIEGGMDPIESVAAHSGFGDPERMRRAFLRAFGQPPQALRRMAKHMGAVSAA